MATFRTDGRLAAPSERIEQQDRRAHMVAGAVVTNIFAFVVLFQLYKMVRKTFIQRAEVIGYVHADQIINLQQRLHIFFEPDLQRWIIGHEWLIKALNWYYAGFMWTFYLCCGLAIIFAPVRFRELRRVFILTMLLALPWYAIYPLAPPRFMPQFGFIDTIHVYGPHFYKAGGVVTANQFAAMPSMHIGWTTIGAFMIAAAFPKHRIGPIIAVLHVSLMTLTVMATGNHYVLDVIGGWMIVGLAFWISAKLPNPLPFPWARKRDEEQVAGRGSTASATSKVVSAR